MNSIKVSDTKDYFEKNGEPFFLLCRYSFNLNNP
jgi:hypothetical protein